MNMREASNAADSLGHFVGLIKRASEVLAAAASVEQRVGDLNAEATAAERNAADARTKEIQAKEALAAATEAVRLATANAAEIEENARGRAAQIVAEAGKAAAKIEAAAADEARRADVALKTAKAEEELAYRKRDAALKELSEVADRIEAAKAEARKAFGG